MKCSVWSYDVLGNARDGYEVNDRARIATIEIRKKFDTDAYVLRLAKMARLLKSTVRLSQIAIDGDDMTAYIEDRKDGYPIGELEIGR